MSTSTTAAQAPAAPDHPWITPRQREAMIAICIMAALADGKCDDHERERIKQVMAQLTGSEQSAETVFQRVQCYQTTMQLEAAEIDHPELRSTAFEMAVGLVNADGVVTSGESAFLDALADALGVDPASAARIVSTTDTLAANSIDKPAALVPPPAPSSSPAKPTESEASQRADSSIQTYAIIAGALELLPQSLASMAIIPLQMKMVYSVGREYGYALDSGHIKDLLATLGVGVTSQAFEGYARRLFSGLIGRVTSGILGKTQGTQIAATATGAAVTFATTYAIGKVAKQYYSGGRTLAAIDLQSLFTKELSTAQHAYTQFAPQIQAQARTLNPANLLKLVRG